MVAGVAINTTHRLSAYCYAYARAQRDVRDGKYAKPQWHDLQPKDHQAAPDSGSGFGTGLGRMMASLSGRGANSVGGVWPRMKGRVLLSAVYTAALSLHLHADAAHSSMRDRVAMAALVYGTGNKRDDRYTPLSFSLSLSLVSLSLEMRTGVLLELTQQILHIATRPSFLASPISVGGTCHTNLRLRDSAHFVSRSASVTSY
eukprot:COSAG01_NODE_918_length_12750_cov_26.992649_3_plen_202_part_00